VHHSITRQFLQGMHVSNKILSLLFQFYSEDEIKNIGKYNFDHPDAFDWELARSIIKQLQQRQDVVIPRYNYNTCKRDEPGITVKCTDLILFEGIFALLDKEIRDMLDLKIFVDTDADIRLLRRITRDILERGR
jgi:uridine kinase